MTTLTEFLLARIAEDEAVAREAIDPDRPGTHWQWEVPDDGDDPDAPRWLRTAEEFPTTSGVGSLPSFPLGFEFKAEPSRGMAHIARHDPARVLAECEAKRRIVAIHHDTAFEDDGSPSRFGEPGYCDGCHAGFDEEYYSRIEECDTLRALALPYADHPDYREEFKP